MAKKAKKVTESKSKHVVNHPNHYQGNPIRKTGPVTLAATDSYLVPLEAIDVIESYVVHDAHLGHALTYLLRAGRKQHEGLTLEQSRIVDLQKARWWITRAINYAGGEVAT